jgi:hypothetical protein
MRPGSRDRSADAGHQPFIAAGGVERNGWAILTTRCRESVGQRQARRPEPASDHAEPRSDTCADGVNVESCPRTCRRRTRLVERCPAGVGI